MPDGSSAVRRDENTSRVVAYQMPEKRPQYIVYRFSIPLHIVVTGISQADYCLQVLRLVVSPLYSIGYSNQPLVTC